ncbi:IclR family transcriptional regulator [Natronolimnobius sp. AArcel1]|uniref:IclR family transcriptional regulator n=1 Tax=Natronolimnobius sp. AArcel1 TaxID=1679093 RepID=UPI0013EDE25C|nr:IclR family transcriptional regulator [Natronolimnobius sp. AArcel1]NGM67964.1 IclR family transcriptional regulator [Natronolimnobius sp. AArcel1]
MTNRNSSSIQSVEHSLRIVTCLREHGPIGVSALAERVDMPKSTVYVHLQTLRNNGYAIQIDGTYDLGLRFLETGSIVRRRNNVYRAAREEVDQLATDVEEAANLGVEQDGKRVILYKAELGEAIYDNTSTGEFTYMHWTAIGKSLLANFSSDRVEEIIDQHGLPQATDQTITEREQLFNELEQIRERGFAVENEEHRNGLVAIAVPIFDTDSDTVVGALSVSGPRQRLVDTADETEIKSEIINAVRNRANVAELRYNHY